ncbi:MAG: TolC family protein [Methylotenera sp.]|nr:TolC family protein [Methylotenera sp.]
MRTEPSFGIQSSSDIKRSHNSILLICLPLLLVACGFEQYIAKPIDTKAVALKIEAKNPESPQFQQFLISNGFAPEHLPFKQWGVDELTYGALFFHPSLDIARAQWRAAETATLVAATKPISGINSHIAHSNNANEDISPFAFGLSIDVPIESANKRDIRIENAKHLSQIAKLEIAQTAWQLRNLVAQSLYETQFNQQQINLLAQEQSFRQQVVAIYQKRVNLGAASNVELSTAKLQLQISTAELNAVQQNKLVLLARLASHLGLQLSRVEAMPLLQDAYNTSIQSSAGTIQVKPEALNRAALLNRLDIRIALERYATAETKLKLEIAKQYPDITISPGYTYEFGNHVWSLGLSGLLTLLNKNKLAIAETTQLREVEAAQFEALQSNVIAEASAANAKLMQAQQALAQQQKLYELQQYNTQQMAQRLAVGEIDRLELTFSKLEEVIAEKNLALAHFQLKTAINQLENTLQQPINTLITQEKLEALSLNQ